MTESDVRKSLRAEVLASAPPPTETLFEFWVPQSNERADVAVVGTTIDGFEIKTDRDSLRRLPRQAGAYTRIFDRCYAILAQRHVDRAFEILPPWWGMRVIDDDLTFVSLRPAEPNGNVDPQTLVRLLRRDEAYAALCGLGVPPDRHAGRFRLWEELLSILDVEGLKPVVRGALLARNYSSAGATSLRFAPT